MKILERLTDAFNKNPNSNIGKIFQLLTSQLDELTETFDQIEAWRVIENAEGDTLDNIGRDLGQYRGGATDEIYRIMLKSKTARDMSEGDRNTIIEVIAMALDTDFSSISIRETWEDSDEPAGISLIEIPIERLNEVGMSSRQFVQFVAGTVAAGVLVKSIDLQGTFEFGGSGTEFDENAGYGDVNDPDIGGYYGELVEAEDGELPI